jgi:hypothetical protein
MDNSCVYKFVKEKILKNKLLFSVPYIPKMNE